MSRAYLGKDVYAGLRRLEAVENDGTVKENGPVLFVSEIQGKGGIRLASSGRLEKVVLGEGNDVGGQIHLQGVDTPLHLPCEIDTYDN